MLEALAAKEFGHLAHEKAHKEAIVAFQRWSHMLWAAFGLHVSAVSVTNQPIRTYESCEWMSQSYRSPRTC